MDCSMLKILRGMQVRRKAPSDRFTVPIQMEGQETEALVDTGYGRMLVRRAKGPWTAEILRMKCIHGNIKEY